MTEPDPTKDLIFTRRQTLEAMALLCFARLLIVLVRFDRWRKWLGPAIDTGQAELAQPAAAVRRIDRLCAKAVLRAKAHLPFAINCLPHAMALHWMLHFRKRPSQMVIAVLPEAERIGRDDLHAWVEVAGEILAGESEQPHQPLIRFAFSVAS